MYKCKVKLTLEHSFFVFKLSMSRFRGHWRGVGRDPPCHALIVIVMLMEGKKTGKLAS